MYFPDENTCAIAESISSESWSYCSRTSLNSIFKEFVNASRHEQIIEDLERFRGSGDVCVEKFLPGIQRNHFFKRLVKPAAALHEPQDSTGDGHAHGNRRTRTSRRHLIPS